MNAPRYIAVHPAIRPLLRLESEARAALRARLRRAAWEQADPMAAFRARGGIVQHLPAAPDPARITAGAGMEGDSR